MASRAWSIGAKTNRRRDYHLRYNSYEYQALLTPPNRDPFFPVQGAARSSEPNSAGVSLKPDKKLREGQYEDFETIDWVKDIARDRYRHRVLHRGNRSFTEHLLAYWDSGSGWFCVLCIGVITGIIAGIIDIGSSWLSDIREGICWDAFWFSKDQCCWSSVDNCQWYTWSRLLIGQQPTFQQPAGFAVGYLFFFAWSLLLAGLCVMLVRNFAPYACGSGIPEIKTILSGFIIRGYLGKWTLLIKSVGMILGVAAGLSLGKEGPMVHMAACCGNIMAYLFPKYGQNEAKKREILSASAAAGVAVAFGAPIGGVLFSLEEASYYFPMKTMFRSFFCAMVSANVLRMLNPYGGEHLVMFYIDYKAQWHPVELIPFALLGFLGGLFGTVFNKANLYICRLRKTTWLGQYPIREVLVVTAATALISFPHDYLRMPAGEMIHVLFSQCHFGDTNSICNYAVNQTDPRYKVVGGFPAGPQLSQALWLLAVALILKGVITVFTFGIKVPTGLFIPSLAAGAIMGRMLGVGIEQLVVANAEHPVIHQMCKSHTPCINPGLYAMVGAAAFLGGVTRMTISLVVVMLELTAGLSYIIPLMVAAMISKWTGDRLTNGSIYEEHIALNNYPYLSTHHEINHTFYASDVMQPQPGSTDSRLLYLTEEDMRVKDVQHLITNSNVKGYPVVVSHESQHLVGWVTRRDLLVALEKERSFDARINSDTKLVFADNLRSGEDVSDGGDPDAQPVVSLHHVVDMSPITVTDQTPMETVLDFFRKMGLRQVLVTKHGVLLGIITKKDILSHLHKDSDN